MTPTEPADTASTQPERRPCLEPGPTACPDFAVFGTDRCLRHQEPVPGPEAHEHEWITVRPFVDGPTHQTCRHCPEHRSEPLALHSIAKDLPIGRDVIPHAGPYEVGPLGWRKIADQPKPATEPTAHHCDVVSFDEPAPRGFLARAIEWAFG